MAIRNRPEEGESWDERSLLLTMLTFTQDVAVWKIRGLTEEQARAAPLPTSPLTSPANILNHLRWVERSWIEDCILGGDSHRPGNDEHPDADFEEGSTLPLDEVTRLYEEGMAETRNFFADADLDARTARQPPDKPLTVRWVLLHLIEETARHNGHLDILREMADGQTGDY
jgi:uncharacterized damage-inducible protein DinB